MPKVYILECADNRYYVGSTIDLDNRYRDHLAGKCRFTKSRLPVRIVYTEEFESYAKARRREYQIKGRKSRLAIEKLIKSTSYGLIV